MIAALPVDVQISPREFRGFERDKACNGLRVLVHEQVFPHPGDSGLARSSWPVRMHMQEEGAHLDIEPRAVTDPDAKDLHCEACGFNQNAIAAFGASR
jgi:hypothetical protein